MVYWLHVSEASTSTLYLKIPHRSLYRRPCCSFCNLTSVTASHVYVVADRKFFRARLGAALGISILTGLGVNSQICGKSWNWRRHGKRQRSQSHIVHSISCMPAATLSRLRGLCGAPLRPWFCQYQFTRCGRWACGGCQEVIIPPPTCCYSLEWGPKNEVGTQDAVSPPLPILRYRLFGDGRRRW